MIDELFACFVIGDLECQRLVPDEPTGTGDTMHGALLFAFWLNPKFVGLQAFHALNYIRSMEKQRNKARAALCLQDAHSLGLCSGEQPQRGVQPNDSQKELSVYPQKIVGWCIVVAIVFCRLLRRRTDCHHSPIYRTTANTRVAGNMDTCGVRAIHPLPE